MKSVEEYLRRAVILCITIFPAMVLGQKKEPSPATRDFFFFPVPAITDEVTIAGEHFKFSQNTVEYNIENMLINIPEFREELKTAGSNQAIQSAQAVLDRVYKDLAYNLIAVEQFGSKSEKLFTLLKGVRDLLEDTPLPSRVVTPRQLYLAIGERSFENINGAPMEFGDITEILTFGQLVNEVQDQLLYRSEGVKR